MRYRINDNSTWTRWTALGACLAFSLMVLAARNNPESSPPMSASSLAQQLFAAVPASGPGWTADSYANVAGAESCGACHAAEFEAWKHSTHFATWRTMHRNPLAKEIADKMGLTGGIKRNDLCYNCHYTARMKNDKPSPMSGVSCESCHGPAKAWIDRHSDYGEGKTIDNEDPAHRASRLEHCDDSGMIRKDRIYLIAANCYGCHSVPNETLVNVGGHVAGSDFNLVAWSQGEVRHNYFYTEDTSNRTASTDRLRLLYVIGTIVDLEYALRGAALVSERGDYRTAMFRRIHAATAKLDSILAAVELADLKTVLDTAERNDNGRLKLSRGLLNEMPDKLAEAARRIVEAHDGSALQAVDPLIPGPETYHGAALP